MHFGGAGLSYYGMLTTTAALASHITTTTKISNLSSMSCLRSIHVAGSCCSEWSHNLMALSGECGGLYCEHLVNARLCCLLQVTPDCTLFILEHFQTYKL